MNLHFIESKIAPLPSNHGRFDRMEHMRSKDGYELSQGKIRPRATEWATNRAVPTALDRHPAQKNHKQKSTGPDTKKGTPNSVTQYPALKRDEKPLSGNDSFQKHHTASSTTYSLPRLLASTSSKAIPIANHSMKRTASELQLLEDEAMADYRDYCMYTRIVNGINERRSWGDLPTHEDGSSKAVIRNIIRTRHCPVKDHELMGPSSYMREGMKRHSMTSPVETQKPFVFSKGYGCASEARGKGGTEGATRVPALVIREPEEHDAFFRFHQTSETNRGVGGLLASDLQPHQHLQAPTFFDLPVSADGHEGDEGVFMMDDF